MPLAEVLANNEGDPGFSDVFGWMVGSSDLHASSLKHPPSPSPQARLQICEMDHFAYRGLARKLQVCMWAGASPKSKEIIEDQRESKESKGKAVTINEKSTKIKESQRT